MTALVWEIDGAAWPNRETSRFLMSGGLQWHVQEMGSGPVLILVHGTGSSTHSWRNLAPILARRFRVISFDLPGHGFTSAPPPSKMTLPSMAGAVSTLLSDMGVKPSLVAGHSAGAAILVQAALDGGIAPAGIVSLNGALLPFGGVASQLFPALARLLFLNPFVPGLFAWRATNTNTVRRLINDTGSSIDDDAVSAYARLFQSPVHVAAALGMMANWDLATLAARLPGLIPDLTLIAGSNDRAIPADVSFKVQERVPGSHTVLLRGLGHLAHEEKPELAAEAVIAVAERLALLTTLSADAPFR